MQALEQWQSFSKNSHQVTLTLMDPEGLLEILSYLTFVWSSIKIHQWQSSRAMTKNSHSDLDLEPRTLDVELVQDIIKSNICVKLY